MTIAFRGAGWTALMARIGPPAAIWLAVSALMLPLLVVTGVGLSIDARVLGEQSVWAKPTKFQLSLGLHFLTLALVSSRLSPAFRYSRLLLLTAIISAAAALAEIAYIFMQAARQLPSHFNVATPFDAAMFSLMAIGAALITGAAAVVGGMVALDPAVRMGRATRLAVCLGLCLGTALTFLTAFRLGANMGHHVGEPGPGALVLPITGWSLMVGDLRVPHFLATHMMQFLPLVGLLADRWFASGRAALLVGLSAIGWTALVLIQFRLALAGAPLHMLAKM